MSQLLRYSGVALTLLLLSTGCSQSSEGLQKEPPKPAKEVTQHLQHQTKHWGYKGEVAPEHWGELNSEFHMCSEGKQQTPIDVVPTKDSPLPHLKLSYTKGAKDIINNGHAVQVNMLKGNTLTIDGYPYALKQFHFHTPSENHINGKSYPMEAHFVHATPNGNLAVISVVFEEGSANPALNRMIKTFPLGKNQPKEVDLPSEYINVLLPADTAYYKFMGSLTTPPCTEGVKWFVLKKPITASKAQLEAMHQEIGQENNRPIQPTNGRLIEE